MAFGRIIHIAFLATFGIAGTTSSNAQAMAHVADPELGVAFDAPGVVRKTADSYTVTFHQSETTNSTISVFTSDRLFVDLPGSYGGKMFTDTPFARLNDRALLDSTYQGGKWFRREYWLVYAGMGMWEGVINCYRHEGGRYYIVSLARNMQLGKPGEDVNGMPLDGGAIKKRLLTSLRDSTRTEVRQFNALLSSVEVLNQ